MLEDAGVVGPQQAAGPRQIIMDATEIQALLQAESSTDEADSIDAPTDDNQEELFAANEGTDDFSNEEETV
jgi:hypothetical protein